MSNEQQAPAGYYLDPAGSGRRRWWNGQAWTDAFEAPHVATAQTTPYAQDAGSTASSSRPRGVNTVWAWIFGVLPLIAIIQYPLMDLGGYLRGIIEQPDNPLAGMSPGYFVAIGLGWLLYVAYVLIALADYLALKKAGVERPFHWAWTFLAALAYAIGRAVVLSRRGRPSPGPLWLFIITGVIGFVAGAIIIGAAMAEFFELISSYPMY
jgi:hypothetical protein